MPVVIALVLLVGCWRGGDTTTPEPIENDETAQAAARDKGASCGEVAANARLLIEHGTDERLKTRAAQIEMVVARRCGEDGWSMELRRCIAGAKTLDDTDGCEKLATKEQSDKLEHDIEMEENAN